MSYTRIYIFNYDIIIIEYCKKLVILIIMIKLIIGLEYKYINIYIVYVYRYFFKLN